MDKEFTPCEQAIEINKLGFNQPCIAYYNIAPFLKKPALNIVKPFEHEWCVPAMLYQQAFRWFREKYNMHFFAQYFTDGKWRGTHSKEDFDTYEEAELACLKKLIEIAKNK